MPGRESPLRYRQRRPTNKRFGAPSLAIDQAPITDDRPGCFTSRASADEIETTNRATTAEAEPGETPDSRVGTARR
ncbi:hypothetical protein IFM12276_17300 [Nocardia sputorum]|uniref:Uncharacterized protein n=1 Tax=Nocardia sputorum TaxID=2984338 RepID=A0ABM8CUP5_9NOCA|nr:hypothetical protein IFM12276_17300 [Nocardia sputorum]